MISSRQPLTSARMWPTPSRPWSSKTASDMDSTFALVVFIIAIALIFDFINGFHDAANSVATVVATQVLTPAQAVIWAAVFNFVAGFSALALGTGVADTVGKGMVKPQEVTVYVSMAGLYGGAVGGVVHRVFGLA